jgi:hypothetical protein
VVIRTVRRRLLVIRSRRAAQTDSSPKLWELPRRQKRRRRASLGLSSWYSILTKQIETASEWGGDSRLAGWVPIPNKV